LYPQADVPVFQVSLEQTRTFAGHLALGRKRGKMRERGILILGSGNLVHNLHKMNWELPHPAYPWAAEFDQNVKHASEQRAGKSLPPPNNGGEIFWPKRIPRSSNLPRFFTAFPPRTRGTT
jgi:4,5-DOPA dioxygenase extradiol